MGKKMKSQKQAFIPSEREDLQKLWREKYQFSKSTLHLNDAQARAAATRTLEIILEVEKEGEPAL